MKNPQERIPRAHAPPSNPTTTTLPPPAANEEDPKKMMMAQKGRTFVWEEPSIITSPPNSLILTTPADLCKTHQDLVTNHVDPIDDVYNTMPGNILEQRRSNGVGKKHVVYTKRQLVGRVDFRIGGFSVKWVQKLSQKVYDLTGEEIGVQNSFRILFMDANGTVEGKWKMEEFISAHCEAQDSAVVLLNCTYGRWEKAELKLEQAEATLLEAYTDDNISAFDLQAALGRRITELQDVRRRMIQYNARRAGRCMIQYKGRRAGHGASTGEGSSGASGGRVDLGATGVQVLTTWSSVMQAVAESAVDAPTTSDDPVEARRRGGSTAPKAPTRDSASYEDLI